MIGISRQGWFQMSWVISDQFHATIVLVSSTLLHCFSRYVLALWKEASEHNCTRRSHALGAKVSFSHEGLHGDWRARCIITTESDLQKPRTVRNNNSEIKGKQRTNVTKENSFWAAGCYSYLGTALSLKPYGLIERCYPNDLNDTINISSINSSA
jgi:hypothetical protein